MFVKAVCHSFNLISNKNHDLSNNNKGLSDFIVIAVATNC